MGLSGKALGWRGTGWKEEARAKPSVLVQRES